MALTLILGGTKSGKSRLAENWAKATALPVTYVATAQAQDVEMQARIEHHRQQRPAHWQTIEEPIQLAQLINAAQHAPAHCLLIDCLTLWLTNLLLDESANLSQLKRDFISSLTQSKHDMILVSNETNMGIVPMGELSRRYCDEAGLLHQQIAEISDNVVLTIAGLPHILKGQLHEGL